MSNLTILRDAVANGNKEKILEILQRGAVDLKTTDDAGDTLLHLAFQNAELSESQLIEILEILLARGLDIKAENHLGKTILHLAVERHMRGVIGLCLRRNADTKVTDKDGNTIAHFAVELECRKYFPLIDAKATTEDLISLEAESSSFIDWLASRGFDFFHAKNHFDMSPIYSAIDLNVQHVLFALLKHIDDLPSVEKPNWPLLQAFLRMNAEAKVALHERGLTLDSRDFEGRYVRRIVEALLEKNEHTSACAVLSAIKGQEDMGLVRLLLERVTDVREQFVMQRFADIFRKLVDKSKVEYGMTALRALLKKGASIADSNVPLELLRLHCDPEMFRLLREHGADFRVRDERGDTCLHVIDAAGMVELLMSEGCDVNATNERGKTPLQLATEAGNVGLVQELIEVGAQVDCVDKSGTTPLETACAKNEVEIAEALIRHGADLHLRTYLQLAVEHSSVEVVRLLLASGLDVNARDARGKTPLHLAVDARMVGVLVEAGAHVDALDPEGRSPLYDSIDSPSRPPKFSTAAMWMMLSGKKQPTLSAPKAPAVAVELLKRGANFVRDPKAFEFVIGKLQSNGDTGKYRHLIDHLVKLVAAGLLDEASYAAVKTDRTLQWTVGNYRTEVESLKSFFVSDDTSLYNWMHKSPKRRCGYVDNEKLKRLVQDEEIEKKFPNYSVLILGYYNEATTRRSLLEPAVRALSEFTEMPWPDLCAEKILDQLSNIELRFLVEAHEDE